MKTPTSKKNTVLFTTSALLLSIGATIGILHAQENMGEVDREPFYSNDRRLQRPTPAVNPHDSDSSDVSSADATLVTFDASSNKDIDPAHLPPPLDPMTAKDGLPAIGVKTGECYAQVLVEAEMVPVKDRILLKEDSYQLVEIPAKFEEVEQRVLVKAGYEKQEVIPATYKTVEEKVLTRSAHTRRIPVEPVYETRTAQVMVKPERVYWTRVKTRSPSSITRPPRSCVS
jgi:hypothetical protein